MDNILNILKYARWYVWSTFCKHKQDQYPNASDVHLNEQLQYLLCLHANRIIATYEEISRKDIANYIEIWVVIQGTSPSHAEPMQPPVKWPLG